jgi:hypothetical protein
MRATYACVKERKVDWNYYERVCTVVGDASTRRGFLQDFRIEMESQMALNLLESDTFRLASYGLQSSKSLSQMDEKLRKIQEAGKGLTPKQT